METIQTNAATGKINLKTYPLSGADLNPTYFILDEKQNFFACILPEFIVIRAGFDSEEKSLRQLAEKYSAERFEKLQAQYAHKYKANLRILNVRIFNPKTQALTKLASVLVSGDKIKSIDATDVKAGEKETEIDGGGGTLIAELYEMHGHIGDNDALLNIAAGVTSVRDMGNNNEVLENLIQKIESGVLAGPRITHLGFIEGKSPFSANHGILVEN